MNIIFLCLLLLMLLFAIAMLVYPLLRVRNTPDVAYKDSNLTINDDKLNELELDLSEGQIDQEHYNQAHNELDRELLVDIPEDNNDNAACLTKQVKRKPVVALMVAVFVPLLVYLVYLDLGMPAVTTKTDSAQVAQQSQQPQMSIPEMTKKLKERIAKTGGSAQDWTMLGRAYKFMKEYDKSSQAYAEALKLSPDNAPLMLERAEVLALSNNRQFVPEARKLILQAVKLEPTNINAIWFAGVAEFQAGNYHKSIAYLTQLAKTGAVSDKQVRQTIISYVTAAREKLIAQGATMPELDAMSAIKRAKNYVASAEVAKKAKPVSPAQPAAVLHIRVRISDKVKQLFKGDDDVFVYAKAKQGPRMPLAVKRMKMSQFPATIVLDDSMAMAQGMNLSAFGQVVVSARITRSGSAIAQAGDYIGTVDVNDVHTDKTINITISKLVK